MKGLWFYVEYVVLFENRMVCILEGFVLEDVVVIVGGVLIFVVGLK